MELAALILAILSFLMSTTIFVWFMAKHFSTHSIQYVPAESLIPSKGQRMDDSFEEFDGPTSLDLAIDAATKNRKITA